MRMETNTERYDGFEQIFDGVQECPVDTEYTLPDYCADIQKILKCIVTPEVTSVSAAGDSLTIDGCASMHVLYLDAKGGCVRGFDTKKEFTCSVRLRAQAENVTAEAEPFVQHMTCRAMNARRVDLHITLGLSVRAYAVRQLEIADCISDDRVETKCEEYDVTRAVGCVMHAFILEQNAELPNGKSPIETVLRCSVRYQIDTVQPQAGGACVLELTPMPSLFFKILGEKTGMEVADETALLTKLIEMNEIKKKFAKLQSAYDDVMQTGYGIVMPDMEELTLEEPEIIKQNGKFGIRLKAAAPSIHMMRTCIRTEVTPIVGSEQQSEDLVLYLLKEFEENPSQIWGSNIFGKSLHELVNEGMHNKLARMPEDARGKVRETIERIINDGCNGLICIIL